MEVSTTTRYLVPDVIAAPSCLTECKRLLRDVLNHWLNRTPTVREGMILNLVKNTFSRRRGTRCGTPPSVTYSHLAVVQSIL